MKAAYRPQVYRIGGQLPKCRSLARLPFAGIKPVAEAAAVRIYQCFFRKTEWLSYVKPLFLRPSKQKTGYNLLMALAVFALRLLEVMFFVGLAGSAVVVLISFA